MNAQTTSQVRDISAKHENALKVQHGFERMRLRGLTGARDEFHLAAIVQNLKTMALRLLRPPTDGACTSIA
jgi:hypothetical protein